MSQLPPRRLQLYIRAEWQGMRLSSVLRYRLGVSGTVLRRIKWYPEGILLDGQRANTDVRVKEGQLLDILLSDREPEQHFPATPGPLSTVYEDRDIIVVNKPAGLSVHPGPGHFSDTLGNYLLWHYQEQGERAGLHPVHRLDKGTSGLLVTAKHPYAQERLRLQLHGPDFLRQYLALCKGSPQQNRGSIELPLGRCADSIQKRCVRPDGDRAVTHYRVLWRGESYSLLRLQLETGRTHQIRVHLAALGHPLLWDFLYGTEEPELIARPALHAAVLSLCHPVTGERLSWTAELPRDIKRLLPAEEYGAV